MTRDPQETYANARIAWDRGLITDAAYNAARNAALDDIERRHPVLVGDFDPRYCDDSNYAE